MTVLMSETESHSQIHCSLYISEAENYVSISFYSHNGKSYVVATATLNFVPFVIDLIYESNI